MSEEKVRLVLDVTGQQDVAALRAAFEDLAQAMGVVGYKFVQTGEAAASAAAGIDDLADAAGSAGGGGGGQRNRGGGAKKDRVGQNLLTLAYAVDDLQYGLRGVMNNIPGVVQALGLGAGMAGVASIAAVAVGQLVDRHPEWFDWSEKVKVKLGELADAIQEEESALKKQKEAVDKLAESNSKRTEDIIRLRQATEDLKSAEAGLAADREARKKAEDAAKNQGTLDAEELKKSVEVFSDNVVDTGGSEAVQAEMMRRLQADPNLRGLASEAAGIDPLAEMSDDDMLAEIVAANQVGPTGGTMSLEQARNFLKLPRNRENAMRMYGQQITARRQAMTTAYDENLTKNVFGRLAGAARNTEDFAGAFRAFGALMPEQAANMNRDRQERQADEEFERSNQNWREFGAPKRRQREREQAEAEAERKRLEALDEEFAQEMATIRKARRDQADREASRRESMVAREMMNPQRWQDEVMRARNAAIEQGRNPMQVQALAARNEQAVMNRMAEGFEKAGFTRDQAAEASTRVMTSVNESLQRMIRTGQMSLDAYGRLQVTVQNMQQQINAQAAEWQDRAFAAGMRP